MDSPDGTPVLAGDLSRDGVSPGASAVAGLRVPFRFAGGVLAAFLVRVPLHALAFALTLFLGAQVLRFSSGAEGPLANVGLWTLALALGLLGLVTGAVAGAVSAAGSTADRLQEGLAEWILALPAGPGAELLPPMTLDEAYGRYDAVVDHMFGATLGRVPMPGPLRRLLRRPFRQAVVEDFLRDCRTRGLQTVGYPELRNWLLARGLPYLLAPFRGQLRLWRVVTRGLAGLALAFTLGLALLAGRLEPGSTVTAISGAVALGVLVTGLTRASGHISPLRWRVGMTALAACLGLWPQIYFRLWPLDLGMVWILVFALTFVSVRWSLRQALLGADPPTAVLV